MICVNCGKTGKDVCKGSMQHPYCEPCFKKCFKNYYQYHKFMSRTHGWSTPTINMYPEHANEMLIDNDLALERRMDNLEFKWAITTLIGVIGAIIGILFYFKVI